MVCLCFYGSWALLSVCVLTFAWGDVTYSLKYDSIWKKKDCDAGWELKLLCLLTNVPEGKFSAVPGDANDDNCAYVMLKSYV